MKKFSLLLALLGLPVLAFANSGAPDAAMIQFYQTTYDWATGGLGVALATTMMLMGGAIGVAQCSPMPTLFGVGGAAFIHWGPAIILHLAGVPIPQPAPAPAPRVATVQSTKAAQVAPVAQQALAKHVSPSAAVAAESTHSWFASSERTKWLGLGGAGVVLSLLGLLFLLSTRRKSTTNGFNAATSAKSTSPAFADPHGFHKPETETVLA
jgi:conjugal transfer pilus assembly protein TraA